MAAQIRGVIPRQVFSQHQTLTAGRRKNPIGPQVYFWFGFWFIPAVSHHQYSVHSSPLFLYYPSESVGSYLGILPDPVENSFFSYQLLPSH
jgi:hypothetical protein